jgi:hypothetical protein
MLSSSLRRLLTNRSLEKAALTERYVRYNLSDALKKASFRVPESFNGIRGGVPSEKCRIVDDVVGAQAPGAE